MVALNRRHPDQSHRPPPAYASRQTMPIDAFGGGQLRAENANASQITVQSVTQMLVAAFELSITEGQSGAATQTAMGLAKLHGFLVDRQQVDAVIHKPRLVIRPTAAT